MSRFHTPEKVIYICQGSKCSKRGGKECYKSLKAYLKSTGQRDAIEIIKTECTDRCKFAPVLAVQPDNIWFKEYTEKEMLRMLETMNTEHKADISLK